MLKTASTIKFSMNKLTNKKLNELLDRYDNKGIYVLLTTLVLITIIITCAKQSFYSVVPRVTLLLVQMV